jgi:hypothetical protein
MSDLPELGDTVEVLTRHHRGELGRVTEISHAKKGSRWSDSRRVFVRLQSVNGSLHGAEGWYEPHEFQIREMDGIANKDKTT